MRDDMAMGATDFAVFEEVVYQLFDGAVDPRELSDVISKQNDASEMHVKSGGLTLKEKRKRKTQAQIGLASNVIGLGAGLAAVGAAVRNPALKVKPRDRFPTPEVEGGPITSRVGRYVKSPANRARLYRAGAVGALALQAGNTAGDVVSNVVLRREANKKLPTDIRYKVKKSLGEVLIARRMGAITTEQAIQMSHSIVEKAAAAGIANGIESEAKKLVPMTAHKALKPVAKPMPSPAAVAKPKQNKALFKAPDDPADIKTPVGKNAPLLTWTGEISKTDTEKRQVFGFATVTHIDGQPIVDRQGDFVPLEEIEKAAYTYVVESRKGGDMHARDGEMPLHTSDLVESFVITPEKLRTMGLDENAVPHGWWVGFKVNDDAQWEKVKNKERTGFSIHGSGRRVEKML